MVYIPCSRQRNQDQGKVRWTCVQGKRWHTLWKRPVSYLPLTWSNPKYSQKPCGKRYGERWCLLGSDCSSIASQLYQPLNSISVIWNTRDLFGKGNHLMGCSYRMKNQQLRNSSGSWWVILVAEQLTRRKDTNLPEPRSRAVADSFLTSLEAEPAWAMAGDISFSFLSDRLFWRVCRQSRW